MASTAASSLGKNRVPVSLRLPAQLVDAVERFSHEKGLSKTDAFVHFLEKGIEASSAAGENGLLRSIDEQVREMLAILKSGDDAHELERVQDAVASAASKFPAVERAYLFGSFARGTFGAQSDVDVRLVLDRDRSFNLRDLNHFAKLVEQSTGREVDVVTADVLKNKSLAEAIDREGVLVYERKND